MLLSHAWASIRVQECHRDAAQNGPIKIISAFLSILSYRNFHAVSDCMGTPPGLVKVHHNTLETEKSHELMYVSFFLQEA